MCCPGVPDMQKMLLLIGPTRSGKGTIARMLTELIGRGHVAGPTLASLGTNFGLSPLLGKPLAIISDARLGDTPAHTVVERLLSITGEDMLTVDRKYREPWSGKLPTRFVILSNELPRFRDLGRHRQPAADPADDRVVSWAARTAPSTSVCAPSCPASSLGRWRVSTGSCATAGSRCPASSEDAANLMMDLASPVSAFVRELLCPRTRRERPGRRPLPRLEELGRGQRITPAQSPPSAGTYARWCLS